MLTGIPPTALILVDRRAHVMQALFLVDLGLDVFDEVSG